MQIAAVCRGDVGRTTAIWRTAKNKQSLCTKQGQHSVQKELKKYKFLKKIGTEMRLTFIIMVINGAVEIQRKSGKIKMVLGASRRFLDIVDIAGEDVTQREAFSQTGNLIWVIEWTMS